MKKRNMDPRTQKFPALIMTLFAGFGGIGRASADPVGNGGSGLFVQDLHLPKGTALNVVRWANGTRT